MQDSNLFNEISSLATEKRNPKSENIDTLPTIDILNIINSEDKLVAFAVEKELYNIEKAVHVVTEAFRNGGRLFYFGAGTSGRLAIVDASECPPTFGTPSDMVKGVIAGGDKAVFMAQEGAEDSFDNGSNDVIKLGINSNDVVCGIAASGRTPYVKGAIAQARNLGSSTIMIATVCKEKVIELGICADVYINPDVGPEVITGSTRMKSGTAQKLVLNMITTTAMVKLGKTFGNVMVDLQLTNNKLKERAKKILIELSGIDYSKAESILLMTQGNVKTALFIALTGADLITAQQCIIDADGFIKKAIEKYLKSSN